MKAQRIRLASLLILLSVLAMAGRALAIPDVWGPPKNQILFEGESAVFSVQTAYVGSLAVQWKKDNVDIPGATSQTLTIPGVKSSDAGRYSVQITDAEATTETSAAKLMVMSRQGGVVGFGDNTLGQLGDGTGGVRKETLPVEVFVAGKTFSTVSAGAYHTVATTSDGGAYAWGYNAAGQLGNMWTTDSNSPYAVYHWVGTVLDGKFLVGSAAGGLHSLVVSADGAVFSWGANSSGQLGNATITGTHAPVAVKMNGALSGKAVKAVAAGDSHSLALTTDGTVYAWGNNFYGQLGIGSTGQQTAPVAVNTTGGLAGEIVTAIASGSSHTLALTSEGKIYAWGLNSSGQLGNSGTAQQTLPVAVDMSGALAGKTVRAIAAGRAHSLALTSDGKVFAWGLGADGQLGNGSVDSQLVPTAVEMGGALAGKTVRSISAGGSHSMVVTTDGAIYVWGANSFGQLAMDGAASQRSPVAMVDRSGRLTGKTLSGLTAGFAHSLAISSDGRLYAWGYNDHGQLGEGDPCLTAVLDSKGSLAGKTITGLEAGYAHALAVTADGGVYSWGSNSSGQLGISGTDQLTPVAVTGTGALKGKFIIQAAAGLDHSLALAADGGIYAWGANGSGQLGDGSTTSRSFPVAVNMNGALAGKTVTRLVAGYGYSMVLASDGSVYAWGSNSRGQLGIGGTTQQNSPIAVDTTGVLNGKKVIAIAAGWWHSLALSSEGKIYSWGYNVSGQLGNSGTINQLVPVAVNTSGVLAGKTLVAIAAGALHSQAMSSDGKLYGWGGNVSGQLGIGSLTQKVPDPAEVYISSGLAGKTVRGISCGSSHSLAPCSDGSVCAWGDDSYGQLGNNSWPSQNVPVTADLSLVSSSRTVIKAAGGGGYSLFLIAPLATAYSQSLEMDEDCSRPILLTGTAADGGPLDYSVVSQPSHGTISGTAPNLAYTPSPNFYGTDSFTFRVSEGANQSNLAVVALVVRPVPDPPVAMDDTAATEEDTSVLVDVLANDSDPDQDHLQILSFTQPLHGVVALDGTCLRYTPSLNFNGNDTFTYVVTDGTLASPSGTVNLWVEPVNDAPVANSQKVFTWEDTPRAIRLTGSDVEGSSLSFRVLSNPSHGTLSGVAPDLTYIPDVNFNGTDSFVFSVSDGLLGSNNATVNIRVGSVNDSPVALADSVEVHNSPVEIRVLENDSDPDHDPLRIVSVAQPLNGKVTFSGSEALIYTPGPSFARADGDLFTYTVGDGKGGTAVGTVTVRKRNAPPVAVPDFASCNGAPVVIAVLANDSDADSDALKITAVTQGASGTVAVTGSTLTYTPIQLKPSDRFTYTISDQFGGTATGTVSVSASVPSEASVSLGSKWGTGDPIKGESQGTTLLKMGIPSVCDFGWKSFSAVLLTGRGSLQAILSGTEVQVLARQGEAAPGWDGISLQGAQFARFNDPVANSEGEVAFVGVLSGSMITNTNRTGLWTNAFGGLRLVAQTGSPMPEPSGGILASIDSIALTERSENGGMLVFSGRLASGVGGVASAKTHGIWAISSSGTSLLLRQGSPVGGGSSSLELRDFAVLGVVIGSPGQGRSLRASQILAQAYFKNGLEAILLLSPEHQPEVVALQGNPLLACPADMTVASFGPPTLGSDGEVGGRVRFAVGKGGVTAASAEAILMGGTEGDYSQVLVRTQAVAPDRDSNPMDGIVFKKLNDPSINAQGFAAFTALLAGAGVTQANDTGIWWGRLGKLRLVARKGDLAPGTAGRFARFTSLVLPDNSCSEEGIGPVFVATLSGEQGNVGLWAVGRDGQLQLVAKKGDLAIIDGLQRTVSEIDALAAVPGSPGQGRSYNSQRTIIYRLTFKGGFQKIVSTVIP